MLWIGVVTLFPEMVRAVTDYGIVSRAVNDGLLKVETWNPRKYTRNNRQTVDDRPYGGGPGMVMMAEPLCTAVRNARNAADGKINEQSAHVIHLTPQGKKLDQAGVMALAQRKHLVLIAGRYKGIDERVIEQEVDEEWSIGDYVLSGGELAAMVLIDALTRTLPGVLGHEDSVKEDSFFAGLLGYPHYTRPSRFGGRQVPEVLLSGNHQEVRRWRLQQTLGRTWLRRPELLERINLDKEQQALLADFQKACIR